MSAILFTPQYIKSIHSFISYNVSHHLLLYPNTCNPRSCKCSACVCVSDLFTLTQDPNRSCPHMIFTVAPSPRRVLACNRLHFAQYLHHLGPLVLRNSVDAILKTVSAYWGRDKMAALSQTTLSTVFSWMKMLEFRLRFHWSLFIRVQLTIFQHWFRLWLGAVQVTSHYLNQWWSSQPTHIYSSLGLNELTETISTRLCPCFV